MGTADQSHDVVYSRQKIVWLAVVIVGAAVVALVLSIQRSQPAGDDVTVPSESDHGADVIPAVGAGDGDGAESASGQEDVEPRAAPCAVLKPVEPVDRVHSLADLQETELEIATSWSDRFDPAGERDRYGDPIPGAVVATYVGDKDRLEVTMIGGPGVLEEFTAQFGAHRVCVDLLTPPAADTDLIGAETLAKLEQWRTGLTHYHNEGTLPAPVLEVVDTDASVQDLLADLELNALSPVDPDLSGAARRPGIHGAFDEVDVSRQRLYALTRAEPLGCPAAVVGITAEPELTLHLDSVSWGDPCNGYGPHTTTLFVADALDDLLAVDELPAQMRLFDGGREDVVDIEVVVYPFTPAP